VDQVVVPGEHEREFGALIFRLFQIAHFVRLPIQQEHEVMLLEARHAT
jgi:hypothetical protein